MNYDEAQKALAMQGQVHKTEDELSLEKLSSLVFKGVLKPYPALEAAYNLGKQSKNNG